MSDFVVGWLVYCRGVFEGDWDGRGILKGRGRREKLLEKLYVFEVIWVKVMRIREGVNGD